MTFVCERGILPVKNSGRAGCSGCDARATPFFDAERPVAGRQSTPAEGGTACAGSCRPLPSAGPNTSDPRLVTVGSRQMHLFGTGFFVFERLVLSHEHVGCLKLIRREVGSHWNRGKDRGSHPWHMDCVCPSPAFHLFIANIPWSSLMSGSFTTRRWLGVRSILVLGIGVLMLAVAVAQKPVDPVADEVMCLYFDERSRTDSDYLVVGLLEGTIGSSKSKEGVVVDLFPPTNDGTRTDSSGTGYLLPAVQSARASARSSSGVNNIKRIVCGMCGYESDYGRYPRGLPASSGDLKDDFARIQRASGDVIECEHCGASCTEPCRCNPTGLELIFGNTDDELVDMQIESDYLHLLFVTCYGMRSVTLYPSEADSNQTLIVAKGWRDHGLTVCPRADESTDGKLDPSSDPSSKHQAAVDVVGNSRPIEASADAPGIVVLDGGGNGCLQ